MAVRNRTRVHAVLSGSIEAIVWEHRTTRSVTYSVTLSGAAKSVGLRELSEIAKVTARAEKWIKSRTD